MCEIGEFRAATVGDDFLNDFFSHWKIVFDDDFPMKEPGCRNKKGQPQLELACVFGEADAELTN